MSEEKPKPSVTVTRERTVTVSPNGQSSEDNAISHENSTQNAPTGNAPSPSATQSAFHEGMIAGALTFFFGGLFMAVAIAIAIGAVSHGK